MYVNYIMSNLIADLIYSTDIIIGMRKHSIFFFYNFTLSLIYNIHGYLLLNNLSDDCDTMLSHQRNEMDIHG